MAIKKINYIKDTKKFWKAHKESRDAIDRDFARQSPAKQRVITDKMRANHTAMRNAKRITKVPPCEAYCLQFLRLPRISRRLNGR